MQPGKKKGGVIGEEPKETAKEDISVGKYYLDQKNWKAALSRFQSALVLVAGRSGCLLGAGGERAAPGEFCGCAGKL